MPTLMVAGAREVKSGDRNVNRGDVKGQCDFFGASGNCGVLGFMKIRIALIDYTYRVSRLVRRN